VEVTRFSLAENSIGPSLKVGHGGKRQAGFVKVAHPAWQRQDPWVNDLGNMPVKLLVNSCWREVGLAWARYPRQHPCVSHLAEANKYVAGEIGAKPLLRNGPATAESASTTWRRGFESPTLRPSPNPPSFVPQRHGQHQHPSQHPPGGRSGDYGKPPWRAAPTCAPRLL